MSYMYDLSLVGPRAIALQAKVARGEATEADADSLKHAEAHLAEVERRCARRWERCYEGLDLSRSDHRQTFRFRVRHQWESMSKRALNYELGAHAMPRGSISGYGLLLRLAKSHIAAALGVRIEDIEF